MDQLIVREATPADAAALVDLARAVGAEPEGWLISDDWRSVGEERKYLRALRRYTHAAVFVAVVSYVVQGWALTNVHVSGSGTTVRSTWSIMRPSAPAARSR